MNKIAILLDIQKQIRNARRVRDLGFIIANKTAGLVPVSNTIFWTYSQGRVVLRSVSGNAVLEVDSPYAQNIKKAISKHLNELSAGQLFHVADITHDAQHVDVTQSTTDNEGQNNSTPPNSNHNPAHSNQTAQSAYNTIMPFMVDEQNIYLDEAQNNDNTNDKPTAKLIGGIWLEHDKPLHDAEEELLKEVSASYGLCLAHLILSAQKNSYLSGNKAKKYKLVLMLIALIAFFFPVRLSVTAPAEIVSAKPFIVSAPFDGILDKVLVSPGDEITPNMIVAQMDKTELQARFDNTEQELNIAQSAYARANLESLRNPERRADLRELQSEINAKRTALEHAELFLSRSDIRAETSGVAIFSDKSSLQDKPIRAGEKILTIADPASAALLIRVPAPNLLPIEQGATLRFHLNPEPFATKTATISVIGYEPTLDADGLLTYKLRAEIAEDDKKSIRIGWQGTAIVPSHWSFLGYSLLRRPMIALRQILGL